jgi:hypothetical protein
VKFLDTVDAVFQYLSRFQRMFDIFDNTGVAAEADHPCEYLEGPCEENGLGFSRYPAYVMMVI